MVTPSNLYLSDTQKNFWVWVDPSNWRVNHQVSLTGSFISAGSIKRGENNLPFIPNPKFQGDISPFSIGITHQYIVEYNFEINREHHFPWYPSRLNAIYLLESEDEAMAYKDRHMAHVDGRVLKKIYTVGQYIYSTHDSSWVDFLRLPHYCGDQTIYNVTQSYWRGVNVADCHCHSMGKSWTQSPIIEVLYLGRIDFYDRSLT
jgi:hypothetical protein